MIFVSSHKPFAESPEYATNQERAAKTWQDQLCASGIYYFGHYEEGLNADHVLFVRKEDDWPRLKDMADFASQLEAEYVAILNADIVVGEGISEVERKMREMALPAATSYRCEFDPETYPESLETAVRHKEDRGMDIFIANPKIWAMVAKAIPEYLRIGHNRWDSWVCGFFCHHLGYGFRQFTDRRCVFHPKHGGRGIPPHGQEVAEGVDDYFTRAKCPSPL